MFSAALYAHVQPSLAKPHMRPRVQRASDIPCSLISEGDNNRQTSGNSCRENADVHLLFEI